MMYCSVQCFLFAVCNARESMVKCITCSDVQGCLNAWYILHSLSSVGRIAILCALACFALIATCTGLDHKVTNKLDVKYAVKS